MKKIILFLSLFILSGCAGTRFQWGDVRMIEKGMTVSEVREIMRVRPYMTSVAGEKVIYTWSYANTFTGTRAVSIVFIDGKVAAAPKIPSDFR